MTKESSGSAKSKTSAREPRILTERKVVKRKRVKRALRAKREESMHVSAIFFEYIKNLEINLGDAESLLRHSASVRFSDPNDLASHQADLHIAEQIIKRQSLHSAAIDAAYERVRTGTYGVCAQCEDEIGENRLRASPIAALCIVCMTKAEAKK